MGLVDGPRPRPRCGLLPRKATRRPSGGDNVAGVERFLSRFLHRHFGKSDGGAGRSPCTAVVTFGRGRTGAEPAPKTNRARLSAFPAALTYGAMGASNSSVRGVAFSSSNPQIISVAFASFAISHELERNLLALIQVG